MDSVFGPSSGSHPRGGRSSRWPRCWLWRHRAHRGGGAAAAGRRRLLMKGPVTGRMLFVDPLAHLYTDVDLLVGAGDRDRAGSVLEDVGFRDFHRSVLAIYDR